MSKAIPNICIPLIILLITLSSISLSQDTTAIRVAKMCFSEVQELCDMDNGNLWNASFKTPFILVVPQTREIYANQPDKFDYLREIDGIYFGILPEKFGVANTSIKWADEKWTMVMLPVQEDQQNRDILLMHESFHTIQEDIGFPAKRTDNPHLDKALGRFWIQMEWLALRQALIELGMNRQRAIEDALIFRLYRRSIYPGSDSSERLLEMHEGLAEYSGLTLCGKSLDQRIEWLNINLEKHMGVDSYINSFAYWSGPAYGILLDAIGVDWRSNLTPEHDFGDLIRQAYSIKIPDNIVELANLRMESYNGATLLKQEIQREKDHKKEMERYLKIFTMDAVLVLEIKEPNIQYDPRNIKSLEELGKIYPSGRFSDLWGVLTFSNGILLSPDWKKITISAPDYISNDSLAGDGWTIKLNEGWAAFPGERDGDFKLGKEQ